MKSVLSSLNSAQTINPELERILEAAIARLQLGECADVDRLAGAHPEHAAQLRELWPAVEMMVRLGGEPLEQDAQSIARNGHAAPPPEHKQLGDFRLIRQIGQGGMGTVYEAEQLSMGRRVALKVLPFAALVQDKSLQRFRNEVRAAAALDHPHIVSIYSVGEERGVHFYAMQLIRGQTLADMIWQLRKERNHGSSPPARNKDFFPPPGGEGPRERGTSDDSPTIDSAVAPPPSTKKVDHARLSTAADTRRAAESYRAAARLSIQAAEALQHAHDLGVLHRDIKPSNLMIDREADLYVTDFGLARIEADAGMTMTGDIIGTLRYMAPEQALAKRVVIDHRADIYSLGATLYELLTLQPAFCETDRSELLKQIAFDEPRPPRKIDRHFPTELETIVLTAMAKNPNERYQSAQQLAEDLRAFLESRPLKAKPTTIINRIAKWSRRHRPLVMSAGFSAAAIAVITIVLLVSRNLAVTRERNEKAAALTREIALRQQAEAGEKIAQASILVRNKRYDEAESLLNDIPAKLISADLSYVGMRRALGWLDAVHERWNEAAANYDIFLQTGSLDDIDYRSMDYVEYGTVQACNRNTSHFEAFRQAALPLYLDTANPVVAERICRICLLLPADEQLLARLGKLYDLGVRAQNDTELIREGLAAWGETNSPSQIAAYKAWGALGLAIVDFRRGNYSKAIDWSEKCLTTPFANRSRRAVTAHAIIAMAQHRLRHDTEAQTAFAMARIGNKASDLGVGVHYDDGRDVPMVPIDAPILPFVDGLYGYVILREADALFNHDRMTPQKGYAAGQNLLGNMHARGLAVSRDDIAATECYRKAAEQGFAAAQLNLAHHYSIGQGVPTDHDQAALWRSKALEQFAWTWSLTSDAAKDQLQILRAIDEGINTTPTSARSLATRGAMLYRAGQFSQAEQKLEQSIAAFSGGATEAGEVLFPRLLVAMTKWQRDNPDAARELATKAHAEIDNTLGQFESNWELRALLDLLRCEARELMQSREVVME